MLKPYFDKTLIEAGCDEAGRGCLAGPVFAAAVILPKTPHSPLSPKGIELARSAPSPLGQPLRKMTESVTLFGQVGSEARGMGSAALGKVNDSKKLTQEVRNELRPIIEQTAIAFAVGIVSVEEIDEINILNASFLAMHRALDKLKTKPQSLLIDGNRFNKYRSIPHHCIIEGDGKFLSIAAASILAKTYRDDYMKELHEKFPDYGWDHNKGYATRFHRVALEKYGAVDHHRKSFTLLPEQFKMDFDSVLPLNS